MRSMRMLLGALACLATMATGAEIMSNPSPGNFIRRSYASVTLIGDYVYIDGGEMSQMLDGETLPPNEAWTKVNQTLSFNISTSWATSRVNILAYDKPAPRLSRQVLWKGEDKNVFWIWGGRTIRGINKDSLSKDTVWRFSTNGEGGGGWSSEIPSDSGAFNEMGLPQRAAYATYKNTGFSFGGTIIEDSDPDVSVEMQPVSGMITFDLNTKTFSNESTPDVSPFGTLVGATAEYIPSFGPNGVIMILGGYGYTLDTDSRTPEHTRRFDNLTFFDPESRQWYWQMVSGEIPAPRLDHCSVGVASGRDTYEIFIFGGYDPTNTETFEDLHVLSLPGFHWTKIDAKSGKLRSGQACLATGNRQMISVGGINTHKEKPWEDKDPFPQGLGVFDMTALKWKDNYDHKAASYDSPKPVQDWYAGGGLNSVKWSSTETEALFTSVTPDVPEEKNTPTGAIAGGVVGGVAGVSLIGVLAWWLLRRRRSAVAASGASPEAGYSAVQTEMDATPKPSELPLHAATPHPSELGGKETPRPAPVELDAPPIELDGSHTVGNRVS